MRRSACVPFPTPGAPTRMIRAALLNSLVAIEWRCAMGAKIGRRLSCPGKGMACGERLAPCLLSPPCVKLKAPAIDDYMSISVGVEVICTGVPNVARTWARRTLLWRPPAAGSKPALAETIKPYKVNDVLPAIVNRCFSKKRYLFHEYKYIVPVCIGGMYYASTLLLNFEIFWLCPDLSSNSPEDRK